MTEFERFYGTRQSYSILWDALETFFREGGTEAYVARVTGSSAATAGKTLNDASAGASLRVDAKNPGVWGNSLSVAVTAGNLTGEFILVVTHPIYGTVDKSPSLVDQAAAINWGRTSDWVTVSLPGSPSSNDPAVAGAAVMTGGADDNGGVTDNQRQAALAFFTHDLGPGQVSIPGNTTSWNRTALIAHARANNRVALLDATDTASRSSRRRLGLPPAPPARSPDHAHVLEYRSRAWARTFRVHLALVTSRHLPAIGEQRGRPPTVNALTLHRY